ncbi:MATE family efflux transporter [Alteromonas sp. a30]|nr:MATE family efflux transporter [Alteromonas sp. a30]
MIISNITTPLIGLVDTAVIGHMDDVGFLAGVALGALILTQLYWVCGFLRMSSTGLSAQAKGENNNTFAARVLWQSGAIGLFIGVVIILLQGPLLSAGLWLADATPTIMTSAKAYFEIRVWSAPFALINLALIGWLVGQQAHRHIMRIQIAANLLNVTLDILLVYVFDLGIAGVAIASVAAEISIFMLSLVVVFRVADVRFKAQFLHIGMFRSLLALNSNMLIRNLALQLCLAFVTYKGTAMGEMIGSTNAIILQFFTLIALGLDGLAYATEALIGEAKGQKTSLGILNIVKVAMLWSVIFAVVYSSVFWLFGESIVRLLTDIEALRQSVSSYLMVIVLLPLVAHWCFLLDGIYIGLSNAKAMRNSMLVCMALFFFPTWYGLSVFENWGLWSSFLIFLALRGMTLGGHLAWLVKQKKIFA